MCPIPTCPVLIKLWSHVGISVSRRKTMVVQITSSSVGQVENFDKSDTSEISEIFSPTSLKVQVF